MTARTFMALGQECLKILQNLAPVKTGNLKFNAIKLEVSNDRTIELYVDESIAPYMPYTNEVWRQKIITMGNFVSGEIVKRMRTWKNPNEGWFDRAARIIALFIASKTKGELKI